MGRSRGVLARWCLGDDRVCGRAQFLFIYLRPEFKKNSFPGQDSRQAFGQIFSLVSTLRATRSLNGLNVSLLVSSYNSTGTFVFKSLPFYGAAPISRQLGSWTVICPHPTPRLVKLVEAGAKIAAVPSVTPSTPTESQSRHLH